MDQTPRNATRDHKVSIAIGAENELDGYPLPLTIACGVPPEQWLQLPSFDAIMHRRSYGPEFRVSQTDHACRTLIIRIVAGN